MINLDFINLDAEGWLEVIPPYERATISDLLKAGKTEEEIAELWLSRAGPEANSGFGGVGNLQTYFSNFQNEIDAFICGDSRYKSDRTKATKILKDQGKEGFTIFISGLIATKIGLAAVAIVPVVALVFSITTKIGAEAYCKTRKGS